ncbi:MAG TPA: hypothetical protein VKQ31_07565 [Steroidobacteraceae bacterium]|nr:hypothetical protein [Steroidobacteraceae bacterium]
MAFYLHGRLGRALVGATNARTLRSTLSLAQDAQPMTSVSATTTQAAP